MLSKGAAPRVGCCVVNTLLLTGSLRISIGKLIKLAPGRPNSAARKPFANTSDKADAEVTSAEYLVTGRNIVTVSIV